MIPRACNWFLAAGIAAIAAASIPAQAQSDGLFADFQTSMGDFTCRLDYVNAPRTVANFVGLATGERTWLDLNTGAAKTNAFYDGLTFHRVISGFMIQGGSPNGLGTDGPGYTFPDEFSDLLRHDSAGVLSMANSGEDSNGSQFFITVAATPTLNDVHSVFGHVESGQDIVDAISNVETDSNDAPVTPVVIQSVSIRRVGAEAQAFNVVTQKLPVVTNVKLGISPNGGESVQLSFVRRAYTQSRLYATEDLGTAAWGYYDLGTEGATPSANGQSLDLTGLSRIFCSLAQVEYPAAPASLLNRTLVLNFSLEGVVSMTFNGTGGGVYVYGTDYGTVYYYQWAPDIFHGYLSPLWFYSAVSTTYWRLDLRLTPLSDGGGTFIGYTYDENEEVWNETYKGTYTLTP